MKVVLKYKKLGMMRFLSPLETAKAIERNLRRAGIDMEFSKGYHPAPLISYLDSISTGVIIRALYLTVRIKSWDESDFERIKETSHEFLYPSGWWLTDLEINSVVDSYKFSLIIEKKSLIKEINGDTVIKKGKKRKEYKLSEMIEDMQTLNLKKFIVLKYTLRRENLFSPWEIVRSTCKEDGIFLPILEEVYGNNKPLHEILEG